MGLGLVPLVAEDGGVVGRYGDEESLPSDWAVLEADSCFGDHLLNHQRWSWCLLLLVWGHSSRSKG